MQATNADSHIRLLRPALRAYGLALATVLVPELFSLLPTLRRKHLTWIQIWSIIRTILLKAVDIRRFPAFCAIFFTYFASLNIFIRTIFRVAVQWLSSQSPRAMAKTRTRFSRFAAALISAWFALPILALRAPSPKYIRPHDLGENGETLAPQVRGNKAVSERAETVAMPVAAGRTIDLTLMVSVRALDATLMQFTRSWQSRRRGPPILLQLSDVSIFALSSSAIMWAWFYHPGALPRSYNKWISKAAEVDMRLIEALRLARQGRFVYGKDLGNDAKVLQSMCKDYNWPLDWGDPNLVKRIPCELVHMGTGPNCHIHAASRFFRAFRFAMLTNLPLQLLAKGIGRKKLSPDVLAAAFKEAARSSAFLASFIMLMYYGICLSRTQIGPRLLPSNKVTPQKWDSGLCVASACSLCGWSILVEKPKRRQELAMFVGPRALATFLPRRYDAQYFTVERSIFALSTAGLLTIVLEDPGSVRGVFGRILKQIMSGSGL